MVRATAELITIDGRRLTFRVEAFDEHQKIGEGQHERFIVDLQRFLQKITS
jgi:predicted thioesterase